MKVQTGAEYAPALVWTWNIYSDRLMPPSMPRPKHRYPVCMKAQPFCFLGERAWYGSPLFCLLCLLNSGVLWVLCKSVLDIPPGCQCDLIANATNPGSKGLYRLFGAFYTAGETDRHNILGQLFFPGTSRFLLVKKGTFFKKTVDLPVILRYNSRVHCPIGLVFY